MFTTVVVDPDFSSCWAVDRLSPYIRLSCDRVEPAREPDLRLHRPVQELR